VSGQEGKKVMKEQGDEHAPLLIGKSADGIQVTFKQAADRAGTHPATIIFDTAHPERVAMLESQAGIFGSDPRNGKRGAEKLYQGGKAGKLALHDMAERTPAHAGCPADSSRCEFVLFNFR
jgi:hypothetical protein